MSIRLFRKKKWSKAADVLKGVRFRSGLQPERMLILNEVWEREMGHYARFWSLRAVRKGVLYVKVRSPAAAQELRMRERGILRSLNKHFKRNWIKRIRIEQG